MSIQPGANLYTQGFGSRPENVEVPFITTRDPTPQDVNYPIGKEWINTLGGTGSILVNLVTQSGVTTATWAPFATSSGDVFTLSGDSGGDVPPNSMGDIALLGTANQITTTGTPGDNEIVWSIPSTFIAPGSIEATSTITADTGLTVSSGGAAITGNSTVTGNFTATTGIQISNGNLNLATAGNKIFIAAGSNATVGVSAAMSGTPGAVTVATTASSSTALIFYSRAAAGGTLGNVSITAQSGTGFTLTSTGDETSTFNWWIINA